MTGRIVYYPLTEVYRTLKKYHTKALSETCGRSGFCGHPGAIAEPFVEELAGRAAICQARQRRVFGVQSGVG